MTKDTLYTLRWYAKKILEVSSDAKAKALAEDMVKLITEDLGDGETAAPAPKPTAPTPAPSNPAPLTRKFGVVVGHTKAAPGATNVVMKMSEYTYNSDLADRMKAYGAKKGVEVFIEKRDSGGVSGAVARVMKNKPQAIVELHFNSADAKSATGVETLYSDSKDVVGIREMSLAKITSDKMGKALGLTLRHGDGLKKLASSGERGFNNVMQTLSIPSILVEPGFGSNPTKDAIAMRDKKQELAESIIDAFLLWSEGK